MSLAYRSNNSDMIRFVEALDDETTHAPAHTPAADYEDLTSPKQDGGRKQQVLQTGRNVLMNHRIQSWEEIMAQNSEKVSVSGSAHRLQTKVRYKVV